MKRPLGVSLISYFYILGAIVLLSTSIFYDSNANQIGIATRFGLSNVPEQLIRVLVALTSFIIIFGYMRLKKWGFWMMLVYSLFFLVISFSLSLTHNQHPFTGNMIWSILVISYTIYVNKYFL
ncbi:MULTISPECIES: hypothetical protein [Peribacillus]|uniref:hypothetical protein n=1 Tax=Peribacillus TaxID=2675229 RepID=UPI001F4E4FDF|nr:MULTISPECIES: hypothetical protein [unclassified Peribacillus]MCK1985684.1 hypothetical protein [Peribacillus sp. Aquil_B1]MCK2009299.1 hypothetical protein [Peribacillus sp. Aquil_B8]